MKRLLLSLPLLLAARVAPAMAGPAHLVARDPRMVAEKAGPFFDPSWSPDGQRLVFTGPHHRGLYVVEVETGLSVELLGPSGSRACGYRPSWRSEREILCRDPSPERAGEQDFVLDLSASPVKPVPAPSSPVYPRVTVDKDDLFYTESASAERRRLTQGEDRFFGPVLSPDKARVAFVGLATGVHVMELRTQETSHLGPGTRPSFSPDSQHLLFERLTDNGHEYTEADIYAWSLESGLTLPLIGKKSVLERHPAVSPDGSRIAYIRDGALWVADLQESRP